MKRWMALFTLAVFLSVSVSPAVAVQARKRETRKRPQVQRTQPQNKRVNNPGLFWGGIFAGAMAAWFLENSSRAVDESFRSRKTVVYRDASGARVEAAPVNYYRAPTQRRASGIDPNSNSQNSGQRECAIILVSSYDENGNVLKSEEQEVCE